LTRLLAVALLFALLAAALSLLATAVALLATAVAFPGFGEVEAGDGSKCGAAQRRQGFDEAAAGQWDREPPREFIEPFIVHARYLRYYLGTYEGDSGRCAHPLPDARAA
jgi:hypothetical protein